MDDVIVQYRVQPAGLEAVTIRRLEPVECRVVQPVRVACSVMAQVYAEFAKFWTLRYTRPDWPDALGQEFVSAKGPYAVGQIGQSGPAIRGNSHTNGIIIQHLHPKVRKRFMKVDCDQPEARHILIGKIHGRK